MNIVYTLNDKFVPQVAAGICSICENNQTENITFYLISDGISKKHQQQLNTLSLSSTPQAGTRLYSLASY